MKKKIGILGGTFNPIHNGHILLAKNTCAQFNLDEILVIPSANPPHKREQPVLDISHRCEMVKLAIQNEPDLIFSDIEARRVGYSYTADTLTELKDVYDRIYFIVGADSLFLIDKWYHPEITMRIATLVVANRNHYQDSEIADQIRYLTDKYGAKIEILNAFDSPVSSSQIRANVSKGISIEGLVPKAVEEYITKNKLYLDWYIIFKSFKFSKTDI